MRTTKFDAASEQLSVAVRLHFADESPLAVRTLVGAAATVLADLSEHRCAGTSWRSHQVAAARQLNVARPFDVLNAAANFLKHADRDPGGVLEFDVAENDDSLFMATLECGEIGSTSHAQQVFQVWYMASYPDKFALGFEHTAIACQAYPCLQSASRSRRLEIGRAMLQELPSNKSMEPTRES
jgi:hypothetical protein